MMNKEKNFASAVIYVHNAETRINEFLTAIIKVMEDNFEHSEIICVNDFSTDNSVQVIKDLSSNVKDTTISLINMSSFHGVENAMNAGVDLAIGDFVFEFDNTLLDFDLSVVMDIYRKSLEGFDIVSASPDRKERLTSNLFYKVFDRFSALPYKMATESFRVLSRRVINRISSINKTVPYRKAIYQNCGLKITNIKYEVNDSSTRALNRSHDLEENKYRTVLAIDSLLLFTNVGFRFSLTMTIAMMLLSVIAIFYSAVMYFFVDPVLGWTTTIVFLSISFFGLFGILTIVIKYLQLILDMTFKLKHYNFECIEKLTK